MTSQAKQNKLLWLIAVLVTAVITLSVFAHCNLRFPGDLEISQTFQTFENNVFYNFMKWLSWTFGSWRSVLMVVITGLIIWWRKGFREAVLIAIAGLGAITPVLFKIIVGRPRPTPDLVRVFEILEEKSFPSGHSLFSMVFLGTLIYLTVTRVKNRAVRIPVVIVLSLLILCVGASRIYLGMHWLSDVLGGFLYALTFLSIIIFIDRRYGEKLTLPFRRR